MGQTVHVAPVHDLHPHDTDSGLCDCHPSVEITDNGGRVVLHNAWDKRELRETKAGC